MGLLSSCYTAPKPPPITICSIDLVSNNCIEFTRPGCYDCKFDLAGVKRIKDLDGYFAVSPEQYQTLRNYFNRAMKRGANTCEDIKSVLDIVKD